MCKQISSLSAATLSQSNCTSVPICKDYNGNVIKIDDYVVACKGKALKNAYEGYVVRITELEYGTFIAIATPGGKTISNYEHPRDYVIQSKK